MSRPPGASRSDKRIFARSDRAAALRSDTEEGTRTAEGRVALVVPSDVAEATSQHRPMQPIRNLTHYSGVFEWCV